MENKFKFGVIGAGFMSSAIVNGAIGSGFLAPDNVIVSDISNSALEKFAKLGVVTTTDNSEVFNNAEFTLLAVKPQHFKDAVKDLYNPTCHKIISIMAGVKKSTVKSAFNGTKVQVVRCMPNTPCSVGYGAIGVDLSDFTAESDKKFVSALLSSFAKLVFVDESKLNAVTGISGSSPAYFYLFIKCLIEAGIKQGLSYDDAKTLAVNTMIGSGKMIFENADKSLDELINAVCSKGGTTIEAVNAFNAGNLADITDKAVSACVNRAKELEELQ